MPEVLFICTGNYYRSRFAEAVFNHEALRAKLPWRAFSRGLAIELAPPGMLSPFATDGLRRRSIPLATTALRPQPLVEADLRRAARAIALKEEEHRPMIDMRFPTWSPRIEFWHVSDLDQTPPDEAMELIESRVRALLEELGGVAPAASPID